MLSTFKNANFSTMYILSILLSIYMYINLYTMMVDRLALGVNELSSKYQICMELI